MIKRTIYFGNPAYLSLDKDQILIRLPEVEQNEDLPQFLKHEMRKTIPIEDVGVVVLDHSRITLTQALLGRLIEYNVAVVTCDTKHMPNGLFLNLDGHQLQSARFKEQIAASAPLKKQLWQQTIKAKILNQAAVLKKYGKETGNMKAWSTEVKSGDPDNYEARAAVYYWKKLMASIPDFIRDPEGIPPNALLNYGYAILRAITARSLVGSGLLPTLGIHHRNQYNAYCLADDIMEPYRPYVDLLVLQIMETGEDFTVVSPSLKKEMLSLPIIDVLIDGQRSPLMLAIQRTAYSLAKCYQGESRKILFPVIPDEKI